MAIQLDRKIIFTEKDTDSLFVIFAFALRYINEFKEKNPDYSSDMFDAAQNTIGKLVNIQESDWRIEEEEK